MSEEPTSNTVSEPEENSTNTNMIENEKIDEQPNVKELNADDEEEIEEEEDFPENHVPSHPSINDLGPHAIQLAIEQNSKADQVETENQALHEQLYEHIDLIRQFEVGAPRAQKLLKTLNDKKAELEVKRKELMQVQAAILNQLQDPIQEEEQSFEAVPTIINRIQSLIMNLTDSCVDENSTSVPIVQIFKSADILNKLYDTVVSSEIIKETPEERQARMTKFITTQRTILSKLQELISQSTVAAEEEEESNESMKEESVSAPAQPKVVEITDNQSEENTQ